MNTARIALRPARPGAPARRIALDLLGQALDRRRPLDQAIASHEEFPLLDLRDRAFARLLVTTTLRRLGQIDAVIARSLQRPLPARARRAFHILRLGAAQLLFLDTPAHAAVDASVALAQGPALAGYRGLVNAVLHRIARDGPAQVAAQDAGPLNAPDWLWARWLSAYGEGTARAIAAAHLTEPPLDFSVVGEPEPWAAALAGTVLPTGSLRRPAGLGGLVEALPGYAEGRWWVQDAAAALSARLIGPVAGKRVIDLCAAPGGKTASLVAAGASVTAVDRAAERLKRVEANLARLRLAAELVAADALSWRPLEPADAVLLDAPCSATGTIRRHPDLPWQKRPEDIGALAAAQDRLLEAAVAMAKPGGVLVYCVCSLEPEEGPQRIAALIAAGAPVERIAIAAGEIPGLPAEAVTDAGDLRTLPSQLAAEGGWDGFYAARLRRRT
jgi:16S rRNA (cytosine967-C5)-methyltransferase